MDTSLTISDIEALVSSHKSAVQEHPELKAFDESVTQKVRKVVDATTVQGGARSSKIWMEAFDSVCKTSELTVDKITKSHVDAWKDVNLKTLAKAYFESTAETLALFNTVKEHLKETENSNLILQFAVKQFETQSEDKYAKTLAALNKFEDIGDPFGEKFAQHLKLIMEQQLLLIKKIQEYDASQESNIMPKAILWGAVAMLACFAVAAIGTAVVLSGGGILGAIPLAVGGGVTIVGSIVSGVIGHNYYQKEYEKEHEILHELEKAAEINHDATDTVKSEIDNVKTLIKSLLDTTDFVEKNVEAIEVGMQKIKGELEEFNKDIKEAGETVAKCHRFIIDARINVLQHISDPNDGVASEMEQGKGSEPKVF